MAGSITYQRYTDDSGLSYSIKMDESNAKGTVGSKRLCLARSVAHDGMPKNMEPRYVLAYNQITPAQKRKFIVGNPNAITDLLTPGAIVVSEQYPAVNSESGGGGATINWIVTYYSGERRKLIPAVNSSTGDTGLTDGSAGLDS
jgi:hypothetical protein